MADAEQVKETGGARRGLVWLAFRVGGVLMVLGAYWLWVGFELCRGRFALVADARSFFGGNLALAAAAFYASSSFAEILYAADPAATPALGAVHGAASALWLWTAAKLLSGNKAPVADLRLFVGGNAALGASLALMHYGTLFFTSDEGMPVAGAACFAAGVPLFLFAAKLLRVTAKRERNETGGGQVAEGRA